MPPKTNPLKLNALQLRTLTILQELAQDPSHALPPESSGAVAITNLPHPHGDHFHLGPWVVRAQDASGLSNESVWTALERKKLIKSLFPMACVLTPAGGSYETGLKDQILHQGGHH